MDGKKTQQLLYCVYVYSYVFLLLIIIIYIVLERALFISHFSDARHAIP
jgi:hypothetical protein